MKHEFLNILIGQKHFYYTDIYLPFTFNTLYFYSILYTMPVSVYILVTGFVISHFNGPEHLYSMFFTGTSASVDFVNQNSEADS